MIGDIVAVCVTEAESMAAVPISRNPQFVRGGHLHVFESLFHRKVEYVPNKICSSRRGRHDACLHCLVGDLLGKERVPKQLGHS
jgi:hypothetical protein